jgi:hypothetical protein
MLDWAQVLGRLPLALTTVQPDACPVSSRTYSPAKLRPYERSSLAFSASPSDQLEPSPAYRSCVQLGPNRSDSTSSITLRRVLSIMSIGLGCEDTIFITLSPVPTRWCTTGVKKNWELPHLFLTPCLFPAKCNVFRVEPMGFEPLTSSAVQSRLDAFIGVRGCSANRLFQPVFDDD